MKKYIFTLIFAFSAIVLDAQWTWQNPKPTENLLSSGFFINQNKGYVVGDFGTILKTGDGGISWVQIPSGTINNLYSVYFVDSETGFAAGGSCNIYYGPQNSIILKTINGGLTWDTVLLDDPLGPFGSPFKSVFFASIDTGYAAGYGHNFRTVDGGETWEIMPEAGQINSIFFTSGTKGYAVDKNGYILKTTDGGISWDPDNTWAGYELFSICFTGVGTGYIAGEGGRILKTVNGGESWTLLNTLTTNTLYSISFTDINSGYATGSDGIVLKTVDGGTTWSQLSTGTLSDLRCVFFSDSNNGCAVGGEWYEGTIITTFNGGTTWIDLRSSFTNHRLASVYFSDPMIGIAVGDSGFIIKTTDGGTNWVTIPGGITGNLSSVFMADAGTGYAVGDSGIIIKTINGGETWMPLSSGIYSRLISTFFTSVNTGFAAGQEGILLKTDDGGGTWQSISTGTVNDLLSVYFINPDTGYIANIEGILKTTDGGSTWTFDFIDGCFLATSVFFINNDIGYVVGSQICDEDDYGAIYKTSDGGITWNGTFFAKFTHPFFTSVYFTDVLNGFVTGATGLLGTIDGGNTWTDVVSTNRWFNAVCFSRSAGYVVGDGGTILSTVQENVTSVPLYTSSGKNLTVFPNPANTTISIIPGNGLPEDAMVTILNMTGQQVISRLFNNQNTFHLDVSTLAKGIYVVRIQSESGIKSEKLVIR